MEKTKAFVELLILREIWVDGKMLVTQRMAGLTSLHQSHNIPIALLQTGTTPVAWQMAIMCGLQQNCQVKAVLTAGRKVFIC